LKDNKEVVIDHEHDTIKLFRKGTRLVDFLRTSIRFIMASFFSSSQEQTDVERFATRIFADDIINMFRHQQDFNVPFQRFIPMYHHHFGYQCRVQFYGCLRLIDLFEEIPHIVDIVEDKHGERILQLTSDALHQAVEMNLIQLIRQHDGSILMEYLEQYYAEMFRFELNYEDMGFDSLSSMLESMNDKLIVSHHKHESQSQRDKRTVFIVYSNQ
jgi:hypothetical protein